MLISILLGVAGLGILISLHEFGHFYAAKKLGVGVEAFSVGWGPVLWSKAYKGTEYRLSAIPIGGYCKLKGSDSLQTAIENNLQEVPRESGSFYSAKWWKRCLILAAGPLMNIFTALILFWFVFVIGYTYQTYPARIVLFQAAQTPATEAGLQTGDRIVNIDGTDIQTFEDIRRSIGAAAHQNIEITYIRNSTEHTTSIRPALDPETGLGRIGIYPYIPPQISSQANSDFWRSKGFQAGDTIIQLNGQSIEHAIQFEQLLSTAQKSQAQSNVILMRNNSEIQLSLSLPSEDEALPPLDWQTLTAHSPEANPLSGIGIAAKEVFSTLASTAHGLVLLFQGVEVSQAVSGPVKITHMVGDIAIKGFSRDFSTGATAVFHFLGLISVVLAFMNLLPIPLLDGGQILLVLTQTLFPRMLAPRSIMRYQNVGAIIVFALLALAVTSDIFFLFGG